MTTFDAISARLALRQQIEAPPPRPQALAPLHIRPAAIQQFITPDPPPPSSTLDRRMAEVDTPEGQHAQYAEVQRICNLPVLHGMTAEEANEYSRLNVLADAYAWGFRLFREQAEAVWNYETFRGGFFPIGVGFGKCECADTEVWDFARGRRRVDEPGPLTTPSMVEGTGKIIAAEATAFPSGVKPCVRLFLKSGQHVGLSTDHPVFTHRGWVHARDLRLEDLVATPRCLPEPAHPFVVDDTQVRLVANFLANGATTALCATLTDEEGPLLEELRKDIAAAGASCFTDVTNSRAVIVRTQGLLPFLRHYGMEDTLSKHKRIPASFYSLPGPQVALFLNRFWAADGCVSKDKLECALASEGMIRDLQFMLLRLGVLSRYTHKKATCVDRGERKWFDAWNLTVTGVPNVLRFLDTVGSPLGHEDKCDVLRARSMTITTNTNTDIVPISRKELAEISDELGHPKRGGAVGRRGRPRTELRDRLGGTTGQYVGRENFAAWVRESGYSGKYAWLATSDLVWERIKDVRDIGTQPVYDLSVPGTHNFIGNGIVLHNTLVSLMVAQKGYSRFGHRKILLLVPSQVYLQLTLVDIRWARARVPLGYPIHELGGKSLAHRRALCGSGKVGVYIMPYSLLSTKDAEQNIYDISPSLIIEDECHEVANDSAAKTRRMNRYITDRAKHGEAIELVAMSGTITHKKITDYHHLIRAALKHHCPLPHSVSLANEWGAVIDATAGSSDGSPVSSGGSGPLMPLVHWAQRHFPAMPIQEDVAGFRLSYRLRLNSAPGVVASGDAEIGTSLTLCNRTAQVPETYPGWDPLSKLIDKVQNEWLTPNGDEIDHAIHVYKWMYELTAGFYNQLTWPEPERLMSLRSLSLLQAQEMIAKAQVHHAAVQEYTKELRKWLEHSSKPGLDTPMLVGNDMARNRHKNVPAELYQLWAYAKSLVFDGCPERESTAIRVCDYKIAKAVDWAKSLPSDKGAILWIHHQDIGRWLYDSLIAAGVNAMHAPAGDQYNSAILDHANGNRKIVASIQAHGTGKNLQHFQEQLVVQWPRGAADAEQMLGRTHRSGQLADSLLVQTLNSSEFDAMNFAACLNDALYIHQTTGNRQKLIYAGYDPVPKIFPSGVLYERGMQNHILSAIQQAAMVDKFGQGAVETISPKMAAWGSRKS